MPRPGILLLLSGGVACAAYAQLPPSYDFSRDLAEITRISAAPDRSQSQDEIIRSFAPANLASSAGRDVSVSNRQTETASGAVAPIKSGTWSTMVMAEPSTSSPMRTTRVADSATRYQLAHDLQQELQRVGCYQGEITGTWNAATRRAMAAFMDRANSVLPYDRPDYVLLALVQSHREVACAAECPPGQAADDGGRCMPRAVIAQAAKKSKRLEARRATEQRLAADNHGTASDPEVLPWLKRESAPAQSAQVALAPRPDPLPGRMSIGGPQVDTSPDMERSPSAQPPVGVAPPEGAGQSSSSDNSASSSDNKVVALQYDPDADDLADDGSVISGSNSLPAEADAPIDAAKSKKSRHSDRESRPRREYYASAGRRRHGDPRPGTARFNLMQSLGGIY